MDFDQPERACPKCGSENLDITRTRAIPDFADCKDCGERAELEYFTVD